MTAEVRTGAGGGFELLVAAAAVADPDWREVFTHGPATYAAVRRHDPELVAATRRPGRYGWINLAGPLAATAGPWSRSRLLRLVSRMPPAELRWTMVGGRRRQLRSRLPEADLQAALAGDRGARRSLRVAMDNSLLQVTPWLLESRDDELRETCLRVLTRFPDLPGRRPSAATTTRALFDLGPQRVLDRIAPGVHYGPGVLSAVVLVTSTHTAPILVAVDEIERTVILHPPWEHHQVSDPGVRLREIGRALGDDTRMRLLHQLRVSDHTLPTLCAALDAPRTTLLHHLALLRSAGLIDLDVGAGAEPNVYSLALAGFDSLATAARAFVTR